MYLSKIQTPEIIKTMLNINMSNTEESGQILCPFCHKPLYMYNINNSYESADSIAWVECSDGCFNGKININNRVMDKVCFTAKIV